MSSSQSQDQNAQSNQGDDILIALEKSVILDDRSGGEACHTNGCGSLDGPSDKEFRHLKVRVQKNFISPLASRQWNRRLTRILVKRFINVTGFLITGPRREDACSVPFILASLPPSWSALCLPGSFMATIRQKIWLEAGEVHRESCHPSLIPIFGPPVPT